MLERMTPEDARDLAALHLRAFPGYFLSSLGSDFLEVLYRAYATDERTLSVVSRSSEGNIQGVIVGTAEPEAFYRDLARRHWVRFAVAAVPALLRSPSIWRRLLRGLRYRGGDAERPVGALLSSVCVDPLSSGNGVGRELLNAWIDQARLAYVESAFLTTDADDNERVKSFYIRAGWTEELEYRTPEGRNMVRYRYLINQSDASCEDQE